MSGFCGPTRRSSVGSFFADVVTAGWLGRRHNRYRSLTFAIRDLVQIGKTLELSHERGTITLTRELMGNYMGEGSHYERVSARIGHRDVLHYDDGTMIGYFHDGPWADQILETSGRLVA